MNYPEKPETCKECIHCEICREDKRLPAFDENQEALCKAFKPKSLFVELPCEVGHKLSIVAQGVFLTDDLEVKKFEISEYGCFIVTEKQLFSFNDVGQNVLLSREDVKKALKERE